MVSKTKMFDDLNLFLLTIFEKITKKAYIQCVVMTSSSKDDVIVKTMTLRYVANS